MASLSSGVLLKLLRDMEESPNAASRSFPTDEYLSGDDIGDGPAVLQVTGIVPALAGSDLFPDRGFYLQVSDSSHSTYVSLPPGHDDLVLSDSLQLGQLVKVRRLEPSSPVPILHGLRLLPGRHSFPHGTSSVASASPVIRPAKIASLPPAPERKRRQPRSASTSKVEGKKNGSGILHCRSRPESPANRLELGRGSAILSQKSMISSPRIDEESEESDSSSVITSISSSSPYSFSSPARRTARKIWGASERLKDWKSDKPPILRTRSATFCQGDFARYGSCLSKEDGMEELCPAKRDGDVGLKAMFSKRKISTPIRPSTKNPSAGISSNTCDDMKWSESNVQWGSLSLNLVKYGKEVLRQRDLALQTALDALQEACAFERLIRCLSTFSELQASKELDPRNVVNRFLDLHQELCSTALVTQTLARPNPSIVEPISASTMEAAHDASRRRKCAASWIKAALESELLRSPRKTNTTADSIDASVSADRKSQGSMSRQRKVTDALPRGSCNLMAADLGRALQSECNRWFLRYIEKFLGAVHSKSRYAENESQVASLLCQLKRIDDWLVPITRKDRSWLTDRSKECMLLEEDDAEASGRVRRTIYEILLRHVETAAMALETISIADDDKVVG